MSFEALPIVWKLNNCRLNVNSSFVKRHERDLIEIFTTFQLIFDCSNNNAVVVVWLPFLQHIHHSPKKAAGGWLVVVVVEYECLAHESATIIANAAAPKETIASVWWRAWPLVQQQQLSCNCPSSLDGGRKRSGLLPPRCDTQNKTHSTVVIGGGAVTVAAATAVKQ